MTSLPVTSGDHADELRAILPRIPNRPGVYRFLGADGEVLYVGKAKELRKRVSSYFRRSGTPHGRTPEMLEQARDIEWVVTASEGEALLLEDNFIKESRPPYNLRLRDDKSYPFIEITMRDEWPRVRFFRGRHVPGNLYFGPYSSARKVREVTELIGRIFPYRKCKGAQPGRPSGSPCLQYFIKRSLAPCDDRVSHEEYMEVVQQAIDFLRGRLGDVERGIEREMAAAAAGAGVREGGAAARQAGRRPPRARAPDGAHRGRRGVRRDRPVPGASPAPTRRSSACATAPSSTASRSTSRTAPAATPPKCWRSSCSSSTGTASAVPPEIVVPLGRGRRASAALLGAAARRQGRRCAPPSAVPSGACSSWRSATPSSRRRPRPSASRASRPRASRRSSACATGSRSRACRCASSATTSPTSASSTPSARWSSSRAACRRRRTTASSRCATSRARTTSR